MDQNEVEQVRKDGEGLVSKVLKNLSSEQLAVTKDGISLGVALADVLIAKVPKEKKKKAEKGDE